MKKILSLFLCAVLFISGCSTPTDNNSVTTEETAAVIDVETKNIIDTAYRRAEEILTQNIDKLHQVAQILLEKEKIDGEEFDRIFNN